MANAGGKSKGGMMGLLIPLVAVTLIGGGGGAFLGFSMLAPKEAEKDKPAGQGAQSAKGEAGKDDGDKADKGGESKGHGAPAKKADAHGGSKADAHSGGHGAPPAEKGGDGHGGGHGDAHGKADGHGDAKAGEKKEELPPDLQVKELPPLITSLGGDKKNWVRLQSAIVYDAHETSHPESLIPAIMADITAFMSTIEMSSIEGPDGLRRLQEELGERAATRSERQVKEFIIESLIVQ